MTYPLIKPSNDSKTQAASSFHPHFLCSGWPFGKGCILVLILTSRGSPSQCSVSISPSRSVHNYSRHTPPNDENHHPLPKKFWLMFQARETFKAVHQGCLELVRSELPETSPLYFPAHHRTDLLIRQALQAKSGCRKTSNRDGA